MLEDVETERVLEYLVYAIAVVTVLWHLYFAYERPIDRTEHGIVHFGLLMVVFYLARTSTDVEDVRDALRSVSSVALVGLVIVTTTYVYLNYDRWLFEASSLFLYTDMDVLVGAVIMVIAVHSTWRAYGNMIAGFVVVTLVYGLFGQYAPGLFNHSGFDPQRLVHLNVISFQGVFGFIMQTGATWVIIFILFAGFVQGYGGLSYINRAARALTARFESGVVNVAIISSMIVGSIMGSSAANTATTGSFTIPLMKRHEVGSKYAAAIESVASTGGQVLPPVMGAAAFLMADILDIPFLTVITAAVIPAILMYVGASVASVLLFKKHGWGSEDEEDVTGVGLPSLEQLSIVMPYLVPFLLLIYLLAVMQLDPLIAGMYSIFAIVPLALVRAFIREGLTIGAVRSWLGDTVEGCKIGVVNMAPLTAVIAALGIIIRTLVTTGFTGRFSIRVIGLAGGVLLVLLILVMFISILFGMGMPTPAAYVVVGIIAAPPLVELGLDPVVAHLFVLYFAVLSTITPPVALTCAVAAGIAGATFWDTAKETIRLGLFLFLIPFAFVMHPEVVLWDDTTLLKAGIIFVGMSAIIVALTGYEFRRIGMVRRAVYFGLGAGAIFVPALVANVGLSLVVVGLLALSLRHTDRSTTLPQPLR